MTAPTHPTRDDLREMQEQRERQLLADRDHQWRWLMWRRLNETPTERTPR